MDLTFNRHVFMYQSAIEKWARYGIKINEQGSKEVVSFVQSGPEKKLHKV